jgi:hypothetical protein
VAANEEPGTEMRIASKACKLTDNDSVSMACKRGQTNCRDMELSNMERQTSLQQERRAIYRTARGLTKKNIRDRIQVTLKTVIFRGVKFITCKEYFDMVMQVILDQEKPADAPQFVRMYKTIVMGALNTKRSTCEQSAQEAAMNAAC